MVSHLHESLILLFRNRPASAAELLCQIGVQLPEYDEVFVESADLNDLRPAEYRADLVLFLGHGRRKRLGVILEVQLGRDRDKPYVWPVYIANLRARHRCPVCLFVITVEESVARWAGKSIELGPGTRCNPWVVGPANIPAVAKLPDAEKNVEIAVLSAIGLGRIGNIPLATRVAATAIIASAGIDAERSKLYIDLIFNCLTEGVPGLLEATMNSFGYKYRSDFARRYFGEGKAEGDAEARMDIILQQLALRFGPLTDAVQACIRHAQRAQLDALLERVLTAQTLDEALAPLR
jgi:hypothetical protein